MVLKHRSLIVWAGVCLVITWLITLVAYQYARGPAMTVDKVQAIVRQASPRGLSAEARAQALRDLVRHMNALSAEERRKTRFLEEWESWYQEMSESEKVAFVEATMPTGVKQLLIAFEKLPDYKRQKTIEESLKHLREVRAQLAAGETARPWFGTQTTYPRSAQYMRAAKKPISCYETRQLLCVVQFS